MFENYKNEEVEEVLPEFEEEGETVETTDEPVSGEVVVEEEPVSTRITTPPATDKVRFKAVRPFAWGGHKLATGVEYEWDEELFDAMMYELNLRTDRLRFVERLG